MSVPAPTTVPNEIIAMTSPLTAIAMTVSFKLDLFSFSSAIYVSCYVSLSSWTDNFSSTTDMLLFKDASCPFIPLSMSRILSSLMDKANFQSPLVCAVVKLFVGTTCTFKLLDSHILTMPKKYSFVDAKFILCDMSAASLTLTCWPER